jgi:hypothetical protein
MANTVPRDTVVSGASKVLEIWKLTGGVWLRKRIVNEASAEFSAQSRIVGDYLERLIAEIFAAMVSHGVRYPRCY